MTSKQGKHTHRFVEGYGLCSEFGCDFQRVNSDWWAKMLGVFAEGQRIEIETVDGWVPGTFVRAVSSTDPNEDFRRATVRTDDGRFYQDAHPSCIRKVAL